MQTNLKKVLVLAGGFPQIALIEELKSRGFFVLLADYNAEPVAKKYCDQYFQVSTLDVEKIEAIAKEEKVEFLLTACTDQALLTVAKVSENLGLPCYIDYQTALNVTNKQYMKDMFVRYDIPTAHHVIMGELDLAKIQHLRYPLVVKPVDCNSSKGVRRCDTEDEIKQYFADAVNFSRTKTAVVEEFIEGSEITVDIYVENGKANLLSISNSIKIAEKDKFVIFRTINPAAVSDEVVEEVKQTAQKIADAFQIKNSPMLIQMLTDGHHAFVIEFSARTGGGIKYLIIRHACGFDVIKAVVDLTLGQKPRCEVKPPKAKYLTVDYVYCKQGVFQKLSGFDELKADGTMYDYHVFTWVGAEFNGLVKASGDRVASYSVCADTPEELIRKHNKIRETIQVLDENGQDMMRHDLYTDVYFENGFLLSK